MDDKEKQIDSAEKTDFNLNEVNPAEPVSEETTAAGEKGRLTVWVVYATAIVSIFSSLQFGYNTGVMTAPSNHIRDFLNSSYQRYGELSETGLTWLYALTVSLYAIGGAVGALAAAPMGDILGR
ncbi:solute carrier family 2, facilitated glucose transporter member 5-like [Ptychodera flava]